LARKISERLQAAEKRVAGRRGRTWISAGLSRLFHANWPHQTFESGHFWCKIHRLRCNATLRDAMDIDRAILTRKPLIKRNFGSFNCKKSLKSIACGRPTPGGTRRPFACAHSGCFALSLFVSRMTISSTFSGTQASNLMEDFALAGVSWPPCSVCHDDLPYLYCLDCPEGRRNVFGGRRPIDGR
jgi:hypothetical protein